MDKLKEIKKGGWHPAESGEKGTFGIRNKVGSVLGREPAAHSSRDPTPISSLRDPSTFAPPPKRILPPPGQAALTQHGHEEAVEEPQPPPRPYRADTTGLSTSNLPPPPRRADGASPVHDGGGPPPPPYTRSTVGASAKPPPPSLPPRLPPRQNTASPVAEAPSRQAGFLNQGAMDRLGAAGVSVPGLGISANNGRQPLPPPSLGRSSPKPPSSVGSGMSELQSRFGKFGVGGGSSPGSTTGGTASPPPPAQGTTWAQKQAALKTMSDFKKNPSSVSLSDAKSAASTANNFRQRHGEQVASGVKTANGLDQKYGVSGKVGGYLGNGNESAGSGTGTGHAAGAQSHLNTIGAVAGLGKKKPPPPPPPKKKPALGGGDGARDDTPPPVPMATRPTF
ncbi:hypothetical protein N0V93_005802 [Gnomoniopsis smithogilvyi]|uniref:GMP synthase n=1 Tax=Gnomoniopsis smithogilvyi TaxID=1191159 RepID=A0A9W9CX19_9PEZI|nr:hypothetical protein N0V93_005802 [Gnomoniopsis smithogilvyi]